MSNRIVRLVCSLVLTVVASSVTLAMTAEVHQSTPLANTFVAMDTALRHPDTRDPAAQAALLKELGYDGLTSGNPKLIAKQVEQLDKHGLKMAAVYWTINIENRAFEMDPAWVEVLQQLKGHGTIIWLAINSKQYKPSTTDGDDAAVKAVQTIADEAAKHGLDVSLYPHVNFYVQRVDDALRLTSKVDLDNVGVTFNLCHWLKVEPDADLKKTLAKMKPYLTMVSINGADEGGDSWRQLIQPLGQGTYDVRQVLRELQDIGYTGPICFQGYGIRMHPREMLKATIEAWNSYKRQLATDGHKSE